MRSNRQTMITYRVAASMTAVLFTLLSAGCAEKPESTASAADVTATKATAAKTDEQQIEEIKNNDRIPQAAKDVEIRNIQANAAHRQYSEQLTKK